jgi:hypothetical protein
VRDDPQRVNVRTVVLRACTRIFTAFDIWVAGDLTVKETARTQQCRIRHVFTVGRRDDDDALVGLKPSISTSSWFNVCSRSSLPWRNTDQRDRQ